VKILEVDGVVESSDSDSESESFGMVFGGTFSA